MSSSTLACIQCGKPIKFDDKKLSQRTGKKIPLDLKTDEPHGCPLWRSEQHKQRRYYSCRKACGQFIYFDENERTENGKWIPLSKETGLPHQCG
jgi:hypothetical protein